MAIDDHQGAWQIVALEVEGRQIPVGVLAGSKITVNGDRFTTEGMGATYGGNLELDSAKSPRTIDMIFTSGPHQGSRSLGIYEFDGNEWRLCLGFAGMSRPAAFATEPGSGHALETLRRAAE